jgi:hypothetical protein
VPISFSSPRTEGQLRSPQSMSVKNIHSFHRSAQQSMRCVPTQHRGIGTPPVHWKSARRPRAVTGPPCRIAAQGIHRRSVRERHGCWAGPDAAYVCAGLISNSSWDGPHVRGARGTVSSGSTLRGKRSTLQCACVRSVSFLSCISIYLYVPMLLCFTSWVAYLP